MSMISSGPGLMRSRSAAVPVRSGSGQQRCRSAPVQVTSGPGPQHFRSLIRYHNLTEFLNAHKPTGAARSLGELNGTVLLSNSFIT